MEIFVKPSRENIIVRNPYDGFKLVPQSGITVEYNSYWGRRIAEGSIVTATTETEEETTSQLEDDE